MADGSPAQSSIVGKKIGPVGYGMLGTHRASSIWSSADMSSIGLSIPWAPVEYDVAVTLLKKALEGGANFWNGVGCTP
jgi:hypothetical protein